MHKTLIFFAGIIFLVSCTMKERKILGSIERIDPAVNALISQTARIEVLGEGYKWSEGPVWVESQQMLLFSDVPTNTIYKWTQQNDIEVYLKPSGYTGMEPSSSKEPGSNGLTLNRDNKLVLCQHGDRRVAMMDAALNEPKVSFITIADKYDGKRFNSPNDVVVNSKGEVFFTDPPYGLPEQENDPSRELNIQGVYKVSVDGKVTLLIDSLTRPNGLAFTPDEKTLVVANSDPAKAVWYAYDVTGNDSLSNARIIFDATTAADTEKGLPDGLRFDKQGNLFASGPGGIWIFNPQFKLIGKIKLPEATANCALSNDEKTLFITSHMYLLRVRLR